MPKSIAQLQAEIEREEKKIENLKVKHAEQKKLRDMKAQLFKMKHHREVEIARSAASGLASLAKAMHRGYKRMQAYEAKIEAKEKKG